MTTYDVVDASGNVSAQITAPGSGGQVEFRTHDGVVDMFLSLADCVARIEAVGGRVPDLEGDGG